MTRIAGDSTTFDDIPLNVDIAMAYCSGHLGVVTPGQMEARFPKAKYGHAWIDVNGTRPDAGIRDWENGDKSGSLEDWITEHNKLAGQKNAVVYCNVSTIPEVRRLTGGHILGEGYFLFVATLDGFMHTGPGIIACQRDGEKQTGGHWDRSFVFDNRFWKSVPNGNGGGGPGGPNQPAKPDCKIFQLAVHVKTDNIWGAQTDKHAWAIHQATERNYPYGISFAQGCVGAKADGDWGPKSTAAMIATVRDMQNALTHMGFNTHGTDGVWGAMTESAFHAARMACHI